VGVAFAHAANADGTWTVYASGGVQDRIWRLTFTPGAPQPISPGNDSSAGSLEAPFLDLAPVAPATRLQVDAEKPGLLYPAGLAVGSNDTVYVAANLADTLVVASGSPAGTATQAFSLTDPGRPEHRIFPYDVAVRRSSAGDTVYVSCWNDASVAVVDARSGTVGRRIPVGTHPGPLLLDAAGARLFVASANADTVSVIDTRTEREIARIPAGLHPSTPGSSTQALALSADETTLFAADALSQAVAVIRLGDDARAVGGDGAAESGDGEEGDDRSRVVGFIPTARYPSALAVVGRHLFVGNGKGEPAMRGNAPNEAFPPNAMLRGPYSVSLMRSSLRRVPLPDGPALARMTTAVMRGNGLVGPKLDRLFPGASPITHVIYVIKENRTYDQVFGDIRASGDGTPADGDPSLALFGNGEAARRPGGPAQDIAPNHRALALRFGLFDRFFVNSEASADGHNWSTAAYSSDYVDKAFRWNYSGRGRTYDYEGFNRLPDYEPASSLPPLLTLPLTADDVAAFMRRYVPYLNGSRDVAEPDTLYIWDAAARAGVTYRSYGEFIGTVSADDIAALNARVQKTYPDVSPTVATVPTKLALEAHHSPTFRAFDMWTPDAMSTESYRAARAAAGVDALVTGDHPDPRFKGYSRLGAWLDEFRGHVAALERGDDTLPALTIMRFPVDHTIGLRRNHATPQFMMADNDYAVGRLVEAVSKSPYWKSTALFILEDDAQDGPDHVDMHRSPVLVVSAWNKKGQLVHALHNTVSAIRTIELLLGIQPMHQLDAAAVPMDVFTTTPDLTPYTAELPVVADDNLIFTGPANAMERRLEERLAGEDLENPDMADSRLLNEAIWVSVHGDRRPMPSPVRLAAVDAMQSGLDEAAGEAARQPLYLARLALLNARDEAAARRR
jgi:YVTN family beta-propeller protein